MNLFSPPRFLSIALAALVLSATAPGALAQIRGLPATVVENPSPSDSDKAQISRFVEAHKADLAAGDELLVRRARNALVEPLENPRVSISFRVEYWTLLKPVLAPLAGNERDFIASNAIHLAGEMAMPDAAESVLRTALRDNRPPVRYAAAFAYKRTFEHMQRSTSVFRPENADAVLGHLAHQISRETHPHVLEGIVRSYEAAALVPDAQVRGLRQAASVSLAKAMGDRARKSAAQLEFAPALIRAGQVIRNAVVNEGLPAQEPRLGQPALREAAGYGGDLLALVKCVLSDANGPGINSSDRMQLTALAASGQNICFFANSQLTSKPAPDVELSALIRDARDDDYLRGVDQYIGRNALLTTDPFGLAVDRFQCRQAAAGPAPAERR